jgi:hypothetical protein
VGCAEREEEREEMGCQPMVERREFSLFSKSVFILYSNSFAF